MQLTKAQKKQLIELFKAVDPKSINIDGFEENKTKWFRFGSYNGLRVASEIVKAIPERKSNVKTINVSEG